MRPEQDALVGIALAAMVADGVIDQAEAIDLEDTLPQLPILADIREKDIHEAMARADEEARALGEEAYLAKCASVVPPRLRSTAFLLAAEIVMSDGNLEGDEAAFLERLREGLGMERATAERLIEATRHRMAQ